ncbi:hypothetical protein GCM10023146_13150 [Nocardioides caricicola]
MQPVLGGGRDPRLVVAAEREGVAARRLGLRLGSGRPAGRERTGRQAGRGDAASDQPSSRDPLGQDNTAAVRRDNGSESALTAFDSSWTCSGVSSS